MYECSVGTTKKKRKMKMGKLSMSGKYMKIERKVAQCLCMYGWNKDNRMWMCLCVKEKRCMLYTSHV